MDERLRHLIRSYKLQPDANTGASVVSELARSVNDSVEVIGQLSALPHYTDLFSLYARTNPEVELTDFHRWFFHSDVKNMFTGWPHPTGDRNTNLFQQVIEFLNECRDIYLFGSDLNTLDRRLISTIHNTLRLSRIFVQHGATKGDIEVLKVGYRFLDHLIVNNVLHVWFRLNLPGWHTTIYQFDLKLDPSGIMPYETCPICGTIGTGRRVQPDGNIQYPCGHRANITDIFRVNYGRIESNTMLNALGDPNTTRDDRETLDNAIESLWMTWLWGSRLTMPDGISLWTVTLI